MLEWGEALAADIIQLKTSCDILLEAAIKAARLLEPEHPVQAQSLRQAIQAVEGTIYDRRTERGSKTFDRIVNAAIRG